MKQNTINKLTGYGFMTPYLTLFIIFLIGPLIFGLGLSFYRWEMLSPAPPKFIGLENYHEALGHPYFRKALWATTRYVTMAVPIKILLALLIAALINTLNTSRQSLYRAAIFLPGMITISVAGILWRWFYNNEFGLFNTYLMRYFDFRIPWISDPNWAMKSIVLMTMWWSVGGTVLILSAGLKQIPRRYYEAASIDGASGIRQFFYITLPLLKPILLLVTVLNVIGAFQVFGQTFMITRGGPELSTRVLVQYIYDTAFHYYRMGYGSAMSWLLFLIIAIFSIIQFRLYRGKQTNED